MTDYIVLEDRAEFWELRATHLQHELDATRERLEPLLKRLGVAERIAEQAETLLRDYAKQLATGSTRPQWIAKDIEKQLKRLKP